MKPPFSETLIVALLKGLGKTLAYLPVCLPQAISIALGDLIYFAPTRLRRIILSNLHHAFPDKPQTWRKKIARESCRRTIELGLFVLASPFINRKRLQDSFTLEPFYRESIEKGDSYVILVPHFSGMEAITLTSLLFNGPIPDTGVIYRPFNNKALERYVKETRERGGVYLLSRKEGFTRAMEMLRRKANVAILFDQNAGNQGTLTLFLDRLASTTELPGLLVQRFKCEYGVLYTERTGFWKGRMRAEKLSSDLTTHGVTLATNAWLEAKLKENDNTCADWLWLHQRWKTQQEPECCLRLRSGRNLLEETLQYQGRTALPKKTRLWIRMPNWLGDIIMALPLIRAIREGRPDADITLLTQAIHAPLLEALGVADHVLVLPKKGLAYFLAFFKWRGQFPDRFILLTNSMRSNFEAKILNATASHALALPGRNRHYITHAWPVPTTLSLNTTHQTALWETWLKTMGLQAPLNYTPLSLPESLPKKAVIGLIAGSENSPEKRWSPHHWRELIGHLLFTYPNHTLALFGSQKDKGLTKEVSAGFDPLRVQDLAGKTDLLAFAQALQGCELVIGNDTGGLHLANALGIPCIGLYGPTNPQRTRPIFTAPILILQPPACPPTGGLPMSHLLPATVLDAIKSLQPSDTLS